VNIDGVPLTNSSHSGFWPILVAIQENFYIEPFVVGIYHGHKKPKNVNDFLRYFEEDTLQVIHNGIIINKQKILVEINCFICDVPARSFITCTIGHNGYYGCHQCIQKGKSVKNHLTYPEVSSPLRTDASFRTRQQEAHHTGTSILEKLNIGMVSHFPLDYMHLVCLGVMKKLIKLWIRGKKKSECQNAVKQMLQINYYYYLNSYRVSFPEDQDHRILLSIQSH